MQNRPERINLFGIPVDNITFQYTLDWISKSIEEFKKEKRARQVATVNVDFMVNIGMNLMNNFLLL